MADASESKGSLGSLIFRESALSKMSSADDLDRYLKVTNPSAWVLVGAVAALLVAAIIWGATATLPIQVSTTGIMKDGQIICFLPMDGTALATTETEVTAAGNEASIISINYNPHSQREVMKQTENDYVASQSDTQWSYMLTIATPEALSTWEEGDDVPIQVTLREVAPLAYLFGGAQS